MTEPDRAHTGNPVAAFFDLDKTIIARSSMLAFSRPFYAQGLINRRAVLKSSYAQFILMLSGAEAEQVERMRGQITELCRGWDVAQVRSIVEETLHDIVEPLVYSQATELIGEHRARGEDVVVISASGEELVKPIAAMLGVQHSVGTRMVIEDGRYTGEIEFYCFGEGKAAAIETLARLHGYDLASSYAYSDSSTDLPMLEAVGHPAVVNPSRGLHRIAVQRQWPELTFSDPTALSAKLASPSGGAVAATALGLGVAAGATWYGLRHKRAT